MIAYHSKCGALILLVFGCMFFGLGIWSMWLMFNLFLKILSMIFCFSIGGVLVYTFVYYTRAPKIAFEIDHQKITIYTNQYVQTHDLVDIQKVAFNFNVPYMAFTFVCTLHKKDGSLVDIACFVRHQVRVYKAMKQMLLEHDIELTRTYRQ